MTTMSQHDEAAVRARGRPAAPLLGVLLAAALHAGAGRGADRRAPAVIDFNRDIRPIFAQNCYPCHGPDPNKRKAGLRLDVRQSAFGRLKSGDYALVPGRPERS